MELSPSLITAVTGLFTAINGWQAGTVLLFVFIVPPVFALWAFLKISSAVTALKVEVQQQQVMSEKHFTAYVNKYDNNIILVRNYEQLAGELSTIVHLNTQAITKLVDRIDFSQLSVTVKPKG